MMALRAHTRGGPERLVYEQPRCRPPGRASAHCRARSGDYVCGADLGSGVDHPGRYLAAGWHDADGNGTWTWHSLRHVFYTTALSCWHLEPTDVSCMAGHANVRVTLDMYVGTTAGVLDRARTATQ